MLGGAVVLAALVAGADAGAVSVTGDVGQVVRALTEKPSTSTTTTTSTSTSTSTTTDGTATPTTTATQSPVEDQVKVEDQVEVEDQVQVQVQDQVQVQVQVQDAVAPLPAAPAGAPLADSVPVVLARRAWDDGGAIERLVEPSGDIVVHAVSPAGTVLSCTPVGSLFRLPIESQADAAGGEVVQLVRDDSGALVRFVVQADGEPRAVAVVEAGPAELSMH